MDEPEKKRILIFGKTYPEPSAKYLETVCTGGITEQGKLIRLYPLSFRYLTENLKFKKWQWIEVEAKKSTDDPRPESYRLDERTIVPLEHVDTSKNWADRKRAVLHPWNVFSSVEALQAKEKTDGTSIGLVKPVVEDFRIERRPETEWSEKQKSVLFQGRLTGNAKPLEFIPWRFVYHFRCAGSGCTTLHKISNLDWEICELYRTCKGRYGEGEWQEKVRQKALEVAGPEKDAYFFLGNMRLHRHVFCIVGTFYPKLEAQGKLF